MRSSGDASLLDISGIKIQILDLQKVHVKVFESIQLSSAAQGCQVSRMKGQIRGGEERKVQEAHLHAGHSLLEAWRGRR